jgi:predicted type IV restriction endonuclease
MLELNLPTYAYKLRKSEDRTEIFDVVRKKYLKLSPEEWVRQHIIHYLLNQKGFPLSHIMPEQALEVNTLKKRCDILAFNRDGKAVLLVECKAPHIKIEQKTFNQIAQYNYALRLNYLFVSNGLMHYYAYVDFENKTYHFLEELPNYSEL